MTTILEVLQGRRSVRGFEDTPVPRELLQQLVEAGACAPTAGNLQTCHFYVVQNKQMISNLFKQTIARKQPWHAEIPTCIVVTTEPDVSAQTYGDRGKFLYNIQDSGAAVQNILLAAHALGLGACWIGAFTENECSTVLGIPERSIPRAIIAVGYPTRLPNGPPKKTVEELTTWIG